MSFYTSVVRYGNSILYRGYGSNGERIYRRDRDFKPVFYVQSQKETNWKSLDGRDVLPVKMDSMREAKEWLGMNEEVSGRYIFGNKNYLQQYITQKFPRDIEFKRELIDVGTIDIETEYEDGFPTPSEASQRILSITYKSSKDKMYRVWAYGDFDREKALIQPVAYYRCRDEASLLNKFLDFWGNESCCPDIVTGWNTRFFDIPYLVNRTAKILGPESIKRFSPWGMVDYRQITRRGKAEDTFDIKGVEQLDYLELFQKFGYSYGPQESYKLNHIASVVLGETKLSFEESGSLKNLYKDDYQRYIDYNMKDVELIERFEDKMGLITLALTIAYKPVTTKTQFAGGYVKDPQVGSHDWVVSFDLNSLYPNIIVQWNMSPETLVDQSENSGVEYYLKSEKVINMNTVAANGYKRS